MVKYIPMLVMTVVIVFIANRCEPGAGIVGLDGYSHGVALCEGGGSSPMTEHVDHHAWKKDGILYIINHGHITDPEVKQLEALATDECHKLWY